MKNPEILLAKAAAKGMKNLVVIETPSHKDMFDIEVRGAGWGKRSAFVVSIKIREGGELYVETHGSVDAYSYLNIAKPGSEKKLRKLLKALNYVAEVASNGIDA